MAIWTDKKRIKAIKAAPDRLVPLFYVVEDLWPRIGFLPVDAENPHMPEFMLFELIFT